MAATNNIEGENIPALRFPEFEREWEEKSITSLCLSPLSNGVFNDPKKVGRGYKLINVKDMYVGYIIDISLLSLVDIDQNEFEKNKVIYGDIFFTRSSLVKEGIAHSNINLSNANDLTFDGHLIRMRPNIEKVSPIFLSYQFKISSARKQFVMRGKTTTMTTIGQNDIAEVKVNYPILLEQQKIADFLTAVDEKIGELSKKKDLLEQYKKGAMQKLFSQQIRFTDDHDNPYPDWEEKKLGDIANIVGGGTPETSKLEYWGGSIQWFTPTEIKKKYLSASKRTLSEEGLRKSSAKKLPVGTLLLSTRATVGDVAIAKKECTTNQGFQSLVVKDQNSNEFWYYWILMNRKVLLRRSAGSTFLEINKSEIAKISTLKPRIEEQQKIADFLSSLDQKIDHTTNQLDQAKSFKKGLLQQMFV